MLHPTDLLVIVVYVLATLGVGFWAARWAAGSLRGYFLAGNRLPWYLLGLSNAAGMFDVSGTMWLMYLLFVYGMKSVWIPWLWPVFNQVFLMMYLSAWLRRSGVMTGAEWIRFRFGDTRGARLAHLSVVGFALLSVVGFLAYSFVGIGKFAAALLPWQLSADPHHNIVIYGVAVTALTTLYVVRGGMVSAVATEIFQFGVMVVACVCVAILAARAVSPDALDRIVPSGWREPSFGWRLDLDWTTVEAANHRIVEDGWSMFGIFFMLMLFKGVLQSLAGPAPNYDMQRILATRSPREAGMMSGLVSTVLFVPRYLLVTGLTVLVLAYYSADLNTMGATVDLELILPLAIREFVPPGLFGLLVAALLAAYMGNFSAKVNAGSAYLVNDIYKRYLRPASSERTYVRASYIASLGVVVLGTMAGLFIGTLHEVVLWLVAALYGGYTAANLLKWYWWRFNAYGYLWGMVTGTAAAVLVPALLPVPSAIYAFPAILAISFVGCIAGSLLTPPDDEQVLQNFYLKVRPWGFWAPVRARLDRIHPGLSPNRDFPRDMLNVAIGIAWQTALVAIGIYTVLQDARGVAASLAIVLGASAVLKFTWYDRLQQQSTYEAVPLPSDTFHHATPSYAHRPDPAVARRQLDRALSAGGGRGLG
ncbi:MAG TPA: sodium:solute symporter family protein [Longimicrobiaceae bacterium]